jgi:hypothetical protein
MGKVAPLVETGQRIANIFSPGSGIPEAAMGIGQGILDKAGEFAADASGRLGANPYVGGAVGMAVANAPAFVMPNPRGAVSALAKPAAAPLESLFASGISSTLGPSREAVVARIADPAKVSGAASFSQLAERLPKSLETVKGKISEAYETAASKLRDSGNIAEGAIPKSQLQGILERLKSTLQTEGSVVGGAGKAASSKLTELIDDLDNILKAPEQKVKLLDSKGNEIQPTKVDVPLPESTVKNALQAIRKNINWDDKGASVANAKLTDASGQIDRVLKGQNPEYAQAMKKVSDLERVYNDTQSTFGITKKTGEGLQPTDATVAKIQSLPQERKAMSQKVARRLKAVTGDDYIDSSKTYGMARQFEGGQTQGSRRVNLGAVVGGGFGATIGYATGSPYIGGTMGTMAGGLAGAYVDRFGGKMAGGVTDAYAGASQLLSRVANSAPGSGLRRAIISQLISRIYSKDEEVR